MEASEQATGTPAPSGAEAPSAQGVDLSPVLDRVNELGNQFQQFQDSLQPQQGYDDAQFMPGYDQYGGQVPGYQPQDPDPYYAQADPYAADQQQQGQQGFDPQNLQSLVQQGIQQGIAQALAPMEQQRFDEQIDQQAAELEQKYEDFRDPQKAEAALNQAYTEMQAIAGQLPPGLQRQIQQANPQLDLAQYLATTPGFVEMAYLASRQREAARQETPASASQEYELEPAGGAAPTDQPSPGSQYFGQQGQGGDFKRSYGEISG